MKHIKVIAFDADDTLWVNEPYFKEIEEWMSSNSYDLIYRDGSDSLYLKK